MSLPRRAPATGRVPGFQSFPQPPGAHAAIPGGRRNIQYGGSAAPAHADAHLSQRRGTADEIQKKAWWCRKLAERAARVHAGIVDASTDDMLKITSDGRKLGLDHALLSIPTCPMRQAVRLICAWIISIPSGRTDRQISVTQLVFCDLSTPKAAVPASRAAKAAGGNLDSPELHALEAAIGQDTAEEPAFTIYDDIREKLVARGIPVSRLRSSMKRIPKRERKSCSQKCAPVRCVCSWAAPSRWALV